MEPDLTKTIDVTTLQDKELANNLRLVDGPLKKSTGVSPPPPCPPFPLSHHYQVVLGAEY